MRSGWIYEFAAVSHNRAGLFIPIEVKLFNSLAYHNDAPLEPKTQSFAAGITIDDLLREIELPAISPWLTVAT